MPFMDQERHRGAAWAKHRAVLGCLHLFGGRLRKEGLNLLFFLLAQRFS